MRRPLGSRAYLDVNENRIRYQMQLSACDPSAVAQLGRLVEQLAARRDERPMALATDRRRAERGHPVAVLEGQREAEMALQATADRVARQRPQQLAAVPLARRGYRVLGVLAAAFQVGGDLADDAPRVGQGLPHTVDELRVRHLAGFGPVEQRGRYVQGHDLSFGRACWKRFSSSFARKTVSNQVTRSGTSNEAGRWLGQPAPKQTNGAAAAVAASARAGSAPSTSSSWYRAIRSAAASSGTRATLATTVAVPAYSSAAVKPSSSSPGRTMARPRSQEESTTCFGAVSSCCRS